MITVTEDEALRGITEKKTSRPITSSSLSHQPILFREITGLENNMKHKHCKKYIDLIQNEDGTMSVDREAQDYLLKMKKTLERYADKSVKESFEVGWSDNRGINKHDHQKYLKSFCDKFYRIVCTSIDHYNEKRTNRIEGDLLNELHIHSYTCLQRSRIFMGRVDIMACFRAYLTGGSRKVLAVEGVSGSGKTALLAHIAKEISTWFNSRATGKEKPVIILRFLGE